MKGLPVAASGDGDEWVSISDLMSGLMLVFLAIAVFFMVQINQEKDELEDIAVLYDELRTGLYEALQSEFSDDLQYWNAEIDPVSLAVRFREPDVLFRSGDAAITSEFTAILDDFFPRYVSVLMGESYRDHIEEVRIEGHTSSEWEGSTGLGAYEQNMALSQARTRSVLQYVIRLDGVRDYWEEWLRERLTANGLSSGRLVLRGDGVEDRAASRRVEFKVRTDAAEQMARILQYVDDR